MTAPRRNTGSLVAPITDSELPPPVVATPPDQGAGRYSLVAPRGERTKHRQRRMLTVLIVEGDPDVGRFLIDILSLSGHAPMHARTIADARLRLEEAPFDLVLLDLQIDGESSAELLTGLAAMPGAPAIIIVSAHHRAEAIAKEQGAAFVRKPFDVPELASAIDRAVFERRSLPPPSR